MEQFAQTRSEQVSLKSRHDALTRSEVFFAVDVGEVVVVFPSWAPLRIGLCGSAISEGQRGNRTKADPEQLREQTVQETSLLTIPLVIDITYIINIQSVALEDKFIIGT